MFMVNSPGELIAGVAPVLGFEPVESLVLVMLEDEQMATVLRVDLPGAECGSMSELAAVAAHTGADAAVAIVVSVDAVAPPNSAVELVGALGAALEDQGVSLVGSYLVDRVAAGGRWACSDGCGRAGVLKDPQSSILAVASAVAGRRMYGTRAAIVELLAVDVPRAAVLSTLIDAAGDQMGSSEESIREAIAVIQQLDDGNEPVTDEALARVGVSLVRPLVRDTLLTLSGSDLDAAAEALWMLLARILPPALRAEALAMIAFGAYARGDGPLAGEAVNTALEINPRHGLGTLLKAALCGGITPAQIRTLLDSMPQAMRLG